MVSTAKRAREKVGEFDQFWARFPRKVGKLAAQKAFEAARKMASLDQILAGVDSYLESKPDYADWCHPKTWLNQGRWMDEITERRTGADRRSDSRADGDRRKAWVCNHVVQCSHRAMCEQATFLGRAERKPETGDAEEVT